jgi:ribosome-binding protein aMBF1 (putative translation factor)
MASAGRLSKCRECGRRTIGYAVVTMRDGARRHFCYECGPAVQRRESDAAREALQESMAAELASKAETEARERAEAAAAVEVAEVAPATAPAARAWEPQRTFVCPDCGRKSVYTLGSTVDIDGARRRVCGDCADTRYIRERNERINAEMAAKRKAAWEAAWGAPAIDTAEERAIGGPRTFDRVTVVRKYPDGVEMSTPLDSVTVAGGLIYGVENGRGLQLPIADRPRIESGEVAIRYRNGDAPFLATYSADELFGAKPEPTPEPELPTEAPATREPEAWERRSYRIVNDELVPVETPEAAPEAEEVETVEQPTAAPATRFERTVNGRVYSVRIADYSDFVFRAGSAALTFNYEVRIHHTPLRSGGGVTVKPATVLRSIYGPRVESVEAALRGAGAVIASHAGVAEAYEYGASGEVVGIFPDYTCMCSACGDELTGESNAIDESGWTYCVSCFESRRAAMLAAAEPEWLPETPAPAVELACSDCGRVPSVLFNMAGVHVCSDCVKHRVEAMASAVRGAGAQVSVSVSGVDLPDMDSRMEALQLSGERRYRESLLGDDADTAEDYAYSSATNYGAW